MQREMTVLVSALLLGLAAWSAPAVPKSGRVLLSLVLQSPVSAYLMGALKPPKAPEILPHSRRGFRYPGWALLQSQSKFDSGALARLTVSLSASRSLCQEPLSVLHNFCTITVILLLGFSRTEHWALLRQSVSAKICGGVVVAVCLAQTFWVVSMGALTQSTLGVHMSTARRRLLLHISSILVVSTDDR